uniref:STAS domain-containing protein n=1 Tax=Glossina austeni TaxID=7395 RepID=A0A1A9VVG6_GLOAU
MSFMENEEFSIHKSHQVNTSIDAGQFAGSTELILITDHRTNKCRNRQQIIVNEKSENYCRNYVRKIFRKKTLYKRLPILQWLPKYSRRDAIGDLIAGITVGLTVIPQGLAYSNVAGLPTQFGLYGSFMGCFVYVLLGTCKDSTVGSTAVASLLTYQVAKGRWERAVLLTFLTGFIEIFMSIFRLGFLVDFVSGPVSAGFTSAVAMIVSTSQIKNILGVQSEGSSFLQRWISMLNDIKNVRVNDAILGICCVAMLLGMRTLGKLKIGPKAQDEQNWKHKCLNKILWFMGVMRNAMLVIVCTAVTMYLESQGKHYFKLTGNVPEGLPSIALPPFSIAPRPANETYGVAEGKPIDATQELLAIGTANVANSLFQGYRANSGLARSAVNNASGVRTPLANLYIGLVVMLALVYLANVLGAIIISAVIFQVQYHVIKPMWRSKRSDLLLSFLAFMACLVMPLEIGILVAIGVNLLFILYHAARPKIMLETMQSVDELKFLKITPDRCLIFPSAEFVRNLILKSGCQSSSLPVVIDCTYIYGSDYTAAKVISSIVDDFKSRQHKIIFFNLKPSIAQIFEGLNAQLILCYNVDSLTYELKKLNGYEDNSGNNKITNTMAVIKR